MAMESVNNVPFVNALAMLRKTATRRKTFKMLVTGPVISVIPQNTLSRTVKQGAATYRITQSKKISNDQELIQSDPTSCPQNQKGNN